MDNNQGQQKICKGCGSAIAKNVKICPHCMKKQGIRPWMIVSAALVVFFIIGIIANSTGGNTSTQTGSSSSLTQKTEYAQGEVANVDGVDYSITSVSRSNGDLYTAPKDGYEYVTVGIKIQNNSNKKVSVNALDWKMEDGNKVESTYSVFGGDPSTSLSASDLNPGGVVEGTLTFEVPVGDTNLTLKYYAFSTKPKVSFKINQ